MLSSYMQCKICQSGRPCLYDHSKYPFGNLNKSSQKLSLYSSEDSSQEDTTILRFTPNNFQSKTKIFQSVLQENNERKPRDVLSKSAYMKDNCYSDYEILNTGQKRDEQRQSQNKTTYISQKTLNQLNKVPKEQIENYLKQYNMKEKDQFYNKNKMVEQLKFMKKDYKSFPRSIKYREVEILFLVDCTASMQPYIDFVKKKISVIQAELSNQHKFSTFYFSFVGYRDYKDEEVESFDFDKKTENLSNHLRKIYADGGGDVPEDMNSGLQKSLKMSWSSHTKIMFIFADAPPHGRKYHTKQLVDSYPNEEGKIEKSIQQIAKEDIMVYFCKITPEVDKTFNIIKEEYEKVNKNYKVKEIGITIKDEMKLLETIIELTSTSIYNSSSSTTGIVQNVIDRNNHFYKHHFYSENQNSINKYCKNEKIRNQIIFKGDYNLYEDCIFKSCLITNDDKNKNWHNIQLRLQESSDKYQILVLNKVIGQGSERVAHYARELYLNERFINWTVKFNIQKCKNNKDEQERMKEQLKSQAVSSYLLMQFNNYAIHYISNPQNILHFVESYIVETASKDLFFLETRLEGFKKHTNNAGYISDDETEIGQLLKCFSHFTFQYTEGFLMITDLQGHNNILTDPAIHTLNKSGYGSTNLGYLGMLSYFITHKCNNFCKKLGLIHPFHFNDDQDEKLDFYDNLKHIQENKEIKLLNQVVSVKRLCFICQQVKNQSILVKKPKDLLKFCCSQCNADNKQNQEQVECRKCNQPITVYKFWINRKRGQYSKVCKQCKKTS